MNKTDPTQFLTHKENLVAPEGDQRSPPLPLIVLASASPRRQSLLRQLGEDFEIICADIEERIEEGETPVRFAERMAQEKALAVLSQLNHDHAQPRVVIGGDTVVALRGKVLGKPSSRENAHEMLSSLSGQDHEVFSAWAIAKMNEDGKPLIISSGVSRTAVTMRVILPAEIESYLDSGEPMDKAGSYGIQGLGGRFVSHLRGSFYSVIGMPLLEIFEALHSLQCLSSDPEFVRQGISLRERCAYSAWRSGRAVDSVQVLAVSKRHSVAQMELAKRCDFHHFGESYAQELLEKAEMFVDLADGEFAQPVWHFIGGIQRNKARRIGEVSQWVHGLTRLSEAERLAEGAHSQGQVISVFIQVKLADEESKSGVSPSELRPLLISLEKLEGLQVKGLMTFPPLAEPEESRVYFRALRLLRDELETEGFSLPHLSMGTSDDFEVAIEEGATWVRLGRCLFGERSH